MKITARLVDVNGSFRKLMRDGPDVFRQSLLPSVKDTAFAVAQRMKATAPVGPDAPHIRDAVEVDLQGNQALVGYLTDSEQASVALYNEYRPNKQPFMRASAEDENQEFKARAIKGLQKAERLLSSHGGVT